MSFIPETPAGTILDHLAADTEDEAWNNLMKDAAHMPYIDRNCFYNRGYRVEEYKEEQNND